MTHVNLTMYRRYVVVCQGLILIQNYIIFEIKRILCDCWNNYTI